MLFGETCQSQTRVCNNGILTGSYGASSCYVRNNLTIIDENFSDNNYSDNFGSLYESGSICQPSDFIVVN